MATPTWLKPKFSYLDACVADTEKVAQNYAGDASEDEFAGLIGISLTSSYFNLRLNSSRAYGLLEYAAKRVKVTSLGHKVVAPTEPHDREYALLTSIKNFPPFKSLSDRYLGKNEPEKQFVENILKGEKRENASEWAECFLKSARYAGLFKARNPIESVLGSGTKVPQTVIIPGTAQLNMGEETSGSDLSPSEAQQGWLKYPVPVPGGIARIIVPSDLSRQAWEKLKKLLDAIEPVVEPKK